MGAIVQDKCLGRIRRRIDHAEIRFQSIDWRCSDYLLSHDGDHFITSLNGHLLLLEFKEGKRGRFYYDTQDICYSIRIPRPSFEESSLCNHYIVP